MRVDNEHTVILDKKSSFLYTSFFLAELLRAKIDGKKFEAFKDSDITGLLNSLVEYGDPSSYVDLKFVFKAAQAVQKLGLAVPRIVETKLRAEGTDGYTLKWDYFDVHGRLDKAGKTVEVKAAGEVTKTSNQYAKISGVVGQSVLVELTQRTEQGLTYVLKETVFPATKLSLQNLQIALTRAAERIKDYPLREGDTLACSQDSKIHIRFDVDRKFDPEYASVYLRHSESSDYSRITSGSGLRFDPEHCKPRSRSSLLRQPRPGRRLADPPDQRQVPPLGLHRGQESRGARAAVGGHGERQVRQRGAGAADPRQRDAGPARAHPDLLPPEALQHAGSPR